jgi:hypothetical protein
MCQIKSWLLHIRIFGFQIQYKRLPSVDAKIEIIAAIKAAAVIISLQTCLSAIGLTAARYHHWLKRQVRCLQVERCPGQTTRCP